MDKFLKNSAGIAAIVIVLIVIVGVVAGGATVLAVRMVVTGEDYLAPFEELGWISSDNNEPSEPEEEFVEEDEEEFSNDLDDLEFPGDDSEIEEGDELC